MPFLFCLERVEVKVYPLSAPSVNLFRLIHDDFLYKRPYNFGSEFGYLRVLATERINRVTLSDCSFALDNACRKK